MKINVLGITNPMFGTFNKDANAENLFPSEFVEYHNNEDYNLKTLAETEALDKENRKKLKNFILQYCGTLSGECYSSDSMTTLVKQPAEKAFNRAKRCSEGGHLSVFGHFVVSLELVGIPKALAMLLNNNHLNNTSERSARYTSMEMSSHTEKDKELFEKWHKVFIDKITASYGKSHPNIFSSSVISKKANENARYIISSFYKTSMVYTNSVREFTDISKCLDAIIAEGENMHPYYKGMKDDLIEFNNLLKATGLVFDEFNDQREKRFTLLSKDNKILTPYYGDCIVDVYKASLSTVAQMHRHRFLNLSIAFDEKPTFFVPPILKDDQKLVDAWLNDCESQIEFIPQALLVNVNEIIPAEFLTLKYGERLCYRAQLEICNVCYEQVKRILKNLDPNVKGVKEMLENVKGSHCTWQKGFKCSNPCGFNEGVNCTRKI